MKRKNSVESLDSYEDTDNGFIEGNINLGKAIASFSFGASEEKKINKVAAIPHTPSNSQATSKMLFNQTYKSSQRGLTPAVDGEAYTIKRCYQFRPSTIRKLSEMRSKHPDVNIYLNTLIDEAISFYYDHLFNKTST